MTRKHRAAAPLFVLALLAVAACTTERRTQPPRTATEQLLMSEAVDKVMEKLDPRLPDGTRVWVDEEGFKDFDQRYALGALKDRLLRSGMHLVARRDQVEVVAEPRLGALSVDEEKMLVGIPSFELPIPLTSGGIPFPEIALFSRDRRRGIAKVALSAYDADGGALRDSLEPAYGFSHKTRWVVLLFVSWDSDDLIPEAKEEDKLLPELGYFGSIGSSGGRDDDSVLQSPSSDPASMEAPNLPW